ncbi:glycerol kinase, partial [Phenoliferia sp. Uapishka_3]
MSLKPGLRPYAFVKFDTFIQRTKRLYLDPRGAEASGLGQGGASGLEQLNEDLRDVTQIMTKNMEDLLWRGDSLDRMSTMSSSLRDESLKYRKQARQINLDALYRKWAPGDNSWKLVERKENSVSSEAPQMRKDRFVYESSSTRKELMPAAFFRSVYPEPGWHEHDASSYITSIDQCIVETLAQFKKLGYEKSMLKGVGITNQRETTVVWDRVTGEPIYNAAWGWGADAAFPTPTAVAWPDTRNTATVRALRERAANVKFETPSGIMGGEEAVKTITGLPFSTYFAGAKYAWLIENVPAVQAAKEAETLMLGTVDSWLLYKYTGGPSGGLHITDLTNASRTLCLSLHTLDWSEDLLKFFDIPRWALPKLVSNSEVYGTFLEGHPLAGLPIASLIGDQQAALVGNKCLSRGDAKQTYGTGCFMLYNTAQDIVKSTHGLLTTVGYKAGEKAPVNYALEGAVAVGGSSVQWLRDNLGLIKEAKEAGELASEVKDTGGVYFVTGFSGLFAPYWDMRATGMLIGLSGYTTKHHIARATLEATCFQTRAILEAMEKDTRTQKVEGGDGDGPAGISRLAVDGGMTVSDVTMQIQADILGIDVDRPMMRESTALGAALLAGSALNLFGWDVSKPESLRRVNTAGVRTFEPSISAEEREWKFAGWNRAVKRSMDWQKRLRRGDLVRHNLWSAKLARQISGPPFIKGQTWPNKVRAEGNSHRTYLRPHSPHSRVMTNEGEVEQPLDESYILPAAISAQSSPSAAPTPSTPIISSPPPKTRRVRIQDAVSSANLVELRAISAEKGGFLNAELRRAAWPILLRTTPAQDPGPRPAGATEIAEDDVLPLPMPHKDEVPSARWAPLSSRSADLPTIVTGSSQAGHLFVEEKTALRTQLEDLIVTVIRKHPALHYFQGYHDIISVILLNVENPELTLELSERLSLHRLRDYMGTGLEPVVGYLRLVQRILEKEEPVLAEFVTMAASVPYFSLSWVLTLMSHDLTTLASVSRLLDFLLSHNPAMISYIAVAIILLKKEDLSLLDDDDPSMIHHTLSKLPLFSEPPSESSFDHLPPAAVVEDDEDLMSTPHPPSSPSLSLSASYLTDSVTSLSSEDDTLYQQTDTDTSDTDSLSALSDSMLSDPDVSGPSHFAPLTSPSPPSSPSPAKQAATVSLDDLIVCALELYHKYPLVGEGGIDADQVLGPKSCVFTWELSQEGRLSDEDAEVIARNGVDIVVPEKVEETKEKVEQPDGKASGARKKKRRSRKVEIGVGTALTLVGVAGVLLAIYGGDLKSRDWKDWHWRELKGWSLLG